LAGKANVEALRSWAANTWHRTLRVHFRTRCWNYLPTYSRAQQTSHRTNSVWREIADRWCPPV